MSAKIMFGGNNFPGTLQQLGNALAHQAGYVSGAIELHNLDLNPGLLFLPKRIGIIRVRMGNDDCLTTFSAHLHRDHATMKLPLVSEDEIVVPEGHPDPASYRRDMASLGMVMLGDSFVTTSMQNIADIIVDIIAPTTSDETKPVCEAKSNGGLAPRLKDNEDTKKRSFIHMSGGEAEAASLSPVEVGRIEMEFNEDFTDVTMLSVKHTSAMKTMSESLMAKHKAEHEFDQAFEIVCETSKAMALKADTTI